MSGRSPRFTCLAPPAFLLGLFVVRHAAAEDPAPLPPLPAAPAFETDRDDANVGADQADQADDADDADADEDDAEMDLENVADPSEREKLREKLREKWKRRRDAQRRRGVHPHAPRSPPFPRAPKPPKPPRPFRAPKVRIGPPMHHHHPAPISGHRLIIFHARAHHEETASPPPEAPPPRQEEDRDRAHGGVALTAGGTKYYGVLPSENVMMGARLHLAAPLPTEPTTSRWLSSATVGLTGGVDVGTSHGVDGQMWRAGLALSMGAPWTRDFIGVGLEGGILFGHYWDGNNTAYSQRNRQIVAGPHGEGIDPKPYGLARLTLQVPLRGSIRPFVSGDFGVTERSDEKLAGIFGVNAGLVWNAW